ncbi:MULTISPECIES: DUF2188 domain-containing protein [unclassified Cupriavidus]|uniref:DUF2188 domain-containing protein n=1 Tax=unclassified Cupriavidus TaxID=2640874 RepID=UPI0002A36A5D|nr:MULTISPECIES: DUF2188 domain-containing protein [unclassified Cupriavidus]EKZ98557.1 hypothetical protein D769_14708 [Cupriavidus sp. HMR-1]
MDGQLTMRNRGALPVVGQRLIAETHLATRDCHYSAINLGAIMASRNIHVMPDDDRGWIVVVEGPNGATVLFPTEAEAIAAATDAAKQDGVKLFIHDRDGQIKARKSFDPTNHRKS